MKIKLLLILLTAAFLMTGCYREDKDDCPPGRYIYFKSVIEKYRYVDFVNNVDLYLYDKSGRLVKKYSYGINELEANNYRAVLPFQPEGSYWLVAQVNRSDDYYDVGGINDINTFRTSVKRTSGVLVNAKLPDIYHALKEISFTEFSPNFEECEIMDLYKNTNHFNVTIKPKNGQSLPAGMVVAPNITGNNGEYKYDNKCIPSCALSYDPHDINTTNATSQLLYNFTTMQIWRASDLTLNISIDKPSASKVEHIINIADYLAGAITRSSLYDTDDKLDREDTFDIEITIDSGGLIIGLSINGWYLITPNEDL